jgi:rhamnogalacturonan acetylesterase
MTLLLRLLPVLCVFPLTGAPEARPVLWLIGDSTVRVGTAGQRGWGEELGAFFEETAIEVRNRAIGGRSSRTFRTEGRWQDVLEALRPGDWVLIQFGHNDGGPINDDTRARGTLPGLGDETEEIDNRLTGQREVVHTYGWYLRRYVAEARARGAVPIVLSLVPRRVWRDGRIERGASTYGGWARAAAAAEGGLFVDLNELVALRYEQMGPETVAALFADERTHTNAAGARVNAECVVAGLRALLGAELEPFLSPAGRAIEPVAVP